MAKILYESWRPSAQSRAIVREAEEICADYASQGYDLTLRQLYYQFVARDLLPNTERSYSMLGATIGRARLAGMLDWDYIVDRTRNLQSFSHWDSPAEILRAVAEQYRVDLWEGQPRRVEVWVEKEALAGVVGQAAGNNDAAFFSCRGYTSQSEMWAAGQRLLRYIEQGQAVIILHLGDHDPSGIDMTRDISHRVRQFVTLDYYRDHRTEFGDKPTYDDIRDHMRQTCGGLEGLTIKRIALNYDQVQQYDPPPNPAKSTDSRFRGYQAEYGDESWELDALDPATLDDLISVELEALRDPELWEQREGLQREGRGQLRLLAEQWDDIQDSLRNGKERR